MKTANASPSPIHDYDREKGTVTIIVQTVGATTEKLSHKQQGEFLQDFVGPLGRPTETEGKKKVCVVGGGVGCAIAYPVLKKFHDCGAEVHAVVGFKNKDVVILEDKFKSASDVMKLVTDDGSYGEKGLVTDALKQLIEEGNQYDEIFAIGPLIMMKFVSQDDRALRHPHHRFHEPHHDRRHRHVRRLPPDRGRRDQVRLRGRPRLRRPQGRLGRGRQARQDVLRLGSVISTKKSATCSRRRSSKMPNMSLKKNPMPSQDPNVRNKNFLTRSPSATPRSRRSTRPPAASTARIMPCVSGCPVQVQIPEFIEKVAERRLRGRLSGHRTRPPPCPPSAAASARRRRQCESKCVRGIKGEPVGIGRLERFVADWHNANVTGGARQARFQRPQGGRDRLGSQRV